MFRGRKRMPFFSYISIGLLGWWLLRVINCFFFYMFIAETTIVQSTRLSHAIVIDIISIFKRLNHTNIYFSIVMSTFVYTQCTCRMNGQHILRWPGPGPWRNGLTQALSFSRWSHELMKMNHQCFDILANVYLIWIFPY